MRRIYDSGAVTLSIRATCIATFLLIVSRAGADMPFAPSNPPEMKPLTNLNSSAHQAARLFRHGVNLGDYLEVTPGHGWGITFSNDELPSMRAEGFDHVRLPIGWHFYTGPAPDYTLSPEIFGRADAVVTDALAAGLAVIIDFHGFDRFATNPVANVDEFLAVWRQVATHYASFSNTVAFELFNEPHGEGGTAVMNPIYARAIAEIRRSNPRRTIFVEPGGWGNIEGLNQLVLPAGDDNLIVSVHCYEPFYFTHQGAPWAGDDVKVTGIQFPGPPATPLVPDPSLQLNPWVLNWIKAYNTAPAGENPSGPAAFVNKIKFARAWSDFYGRPVHLGEFGCYKKIDPESRARFYAAVRRALDENRLGWAIWDWSANFHYWDRENHRPFPGMREALFK